MGAVLDLDQLHKVLEDFSEATGLATVAVDTRGVPVTPACAFTDFCRMMRSDPMRDKLCHGCDAHGGLQSMIEGSPQAYRCHSGLVDFSVPVTDGDKYVGAILCGQVRVPEAEQPDFLTSRTSWRGEDQLDELYEQVPTSSLKKIAAAAKTLLGLSMSIDGVRTHRVATRQATVVKPQLPVLALVPYRRPPEPEQDAAPVPPAPEGFAAVRAAMDAEDLAGAFAEASQLLDGAFAAPGDVREHVAALEDVVLAVTADCAPRLVPHLTQVVNRQRERRTLSVNRYQTQLYLERLLGMLLDEIVRSRPHRRRDLRDLLNDIARHPNRALSLTEAAAATHWSPGHLSKLFKSVTGYTFVSYVTAWRIQRARLMLASTQMPVQKIATELDFNQVNYFSRVFRAHTGMSPSEYRRQFSARDGRPTGVSLPAHHHALLRA
ncbi:MAG: PocR ligand-binding domain-containing protein [Propionicimonas sp.]|uniref:PocR ligand-binding domain-containing protein n=1 Tax=Propionicimonas sp. TaxID=1955623 RepID=UPI003D0EECF2